jgi:hypothetical protein
VRALTGDEIIRDEVYGTEVIIPSDNVDREGPLDGSNSIGYEISSPTSKL